MFHLTEAVFYFTETINLSTSSTSSHVLSVNRGQSLFSQNALLCLLFARLSLSLSLSLDFIPDKETFPVFISQRSLHLSLLSPSADLSSPAHAIRYWIQEAAANANYCVG